ncbi:hypothetical protein AA313_de0204217 [Arthrobotrys entomopaga]|nr:hypothetical protein AA313_de0204217 [Arthrobotrys entomopaga]
MRLAKINLIRKGRLTIGTPTQTASGLFSLDTKPIGAFWYIKDELDDNAAKKIARAKQIDGYRGNIFYGSAEKVWEQQHNLQDAAQNKSFQPQTSNFIGRSYGLLSDEEGDDEQSNNELENIDLHMSPQQSRLMTPLDPLSPPLSPVTTQNASALHGKDDRILPMPGSFVFEEEIPTSPTFSSMLTESIQNLPEFLFSTPTRPSYVNPGMALEHRYDSASPLPQHARFDMTPRQLAAFSRRKQEFERLIERPSTPSAVSDAGTDDWDLSEKERAERERRRRDLQKFRLERQKRLRLESSSGSRSQSGETKKRAWDDLENIGLDVHSALSTSKRSKSSEIFASALSTQHPCKLRGNLFVSNDELIVLDHTPTPASASYQQPVLLPTANPIEGTDKAYVAPTPSPSPPRQSENNISKPSQRHVPKVPSGLRRAINVSNSPAKSPFKITPKFQNHQPLTRTVGLEKHIRSEANCIPRSSHKNFKFPPLVASYVAQVNPNIFKELSPHFQVARA